MDLGRLAAGWAGRAPTLAAMSLLAGVVWHFWIAPVLVGSALLAVIASVVGYLQQVTYKRYPRD